jgi:hypothetical protein
MRNRNHDTDTSAMIKQMTEEIYRLAEEQARALKKATFLGMTTDEANECDSRAWQHQPFDRRSSASAEYEGAQRVIAGPRT